MERLISIILPVYNGERYLAESIESILNQSYQNLELIIVDDCSTDSTKSIILSYAEQDERIIYLRNDTNLKLPASLNRGFRQARGEYWTWTSDDNLYMPTAIERMAEFLDGHPDIAMVYCDMDVIDETGSVIKQLPVGNPDRLLYENIVYACFLYRKQAADMVGEYDTSRFLVEDYEYWLRIYLAFQIAPIHECFYQYRTHSGALTNTRQPEIRAAVKKLHVDYLDAYEKAHLPNKLLFPYFEYLFKNNLITTECRKRKLEFSARHPAYLLVWLRKKTMRKLKQH